jgi:diguanylate cyclase (GGDEF)-like protein
VCLAVFGMTRWWWGRPTRELRNLIERIRAGDAPIEELAAIRHGPRAIVPVIQSLLRDLREQRRELATLNEEIRQRVAHRTDALERTIGTLRHHATRDGLTGLFNRRFLDTFLPQVLKRCSEKGLDITLVMADLDHFKLLNDTLGHAAGDELLRSIGQLIRSTIRGEDAAFRLGGDEFVIVMPACGPAQGRALAERLASLVDALGRTYKVARRPRMSYGVACLTEVPGGSPAELMLRADQALYDCKRARQAERDPASNSLSEPLQPDGPSIQCPAQ